VSAYPVAIEGEGLDALVVGGGDVAARKARALLDAGATVRAVALEPGASMRALAARDRLTIIARAYESGDIGDALLVVAATDDRETNARVAADAAASHRLVNVADAPDEGNCATMATHRAGELVVGVTAGGVPGAAARVRDAIAARYDERYAAAIGALRVLRRTLLARGDREAWGRAARELVTAEFCVDVERGGHAERVRTWR
jgi:precorrin-2 dehydrogenase/sirohydrochlorin ferrochelatase